jgi:hypothetical protein
VLPRFEVVARRRPVRLVVPGTSLPPVAPYAAAQASVTGPGRAEVVLASGDVTIAAEHDGAVGLVVTTGSQTTIHRSRRFGRPEAPVDGLALTLTGRQVTALTEEHGRWVARARYDLTDRIDVHDEEWLSGLEASSDGPLDDVVGGSFGQLGLRDLRVVSNADGTAYRPESGDPTVLLTASSSGPGGFPTSHTSVWALDTETYDLEHRADLFFRRPDRPGVFGDHAAHLVREDDRWLVATSTWGDFDRTRADVSVGVTLAETGEDLLSGTHALDTRPLTLPTTGLRSVGVWDPHLVRTETGWLVGYVNATKFFRFHPALAEGPDLDSLSLRAADGRRRATEGTTVARIDGDWRVLASDGRDGRRGQRAAYPVFDLDLQQLGVLDAAYPTNLPWPTLVRIDDRWLMVGFNGAPYGGQLVGYGSHGSVVVQRASL